VQGTKKFPLGGNFFFERFAARTNASHHPKRSIVRTFKKYVRTLFIKKYRPMFFESYPHARAKKYCFYF